MGKAAVFLDRDGVINRCAPPQEYILDWEDFVILDGVPEAIRKLNDSGFLVLVVSNQRCIARGLATREQIDALHRKLNETLQKSGAHIDAFYICPHDIGQCCCRKPEIGLFLQAESEHGIDRSASWMIGDSASDMLAGHTYGVSTVCIGEETVACDEKCPSLLAAAGRILEKRRSKQ